MAGLGALVDHYCHLLGLMAVLNIFLKTYRETMNRNVDNLQRIRILNALNLHDDFHLVDLIVIIRILRPVSD